MYIPSYWQVYYHIYDRLNKEEENLLICNMQNSYLSLESTE